MRAATAAAVWAPNDPAGRGGSCRRAESRPASRSNGLSGRLVRARGSTSPWRAAVWRAEGGGALRDVAAGGAWRVDAVLRRSDAGSAVVARGAAWEADCGAAKRGTPTALFGAVIAGARCTGARLAGATARGAGAAVNVHAAISDTVGTEAGRGQVPKVGLGAPVRGAEPLRGAGAKWSESRLSRGGLRGVMWAHGRIEVMR